MANGNSAPTVTMDPGDSDLQAKPPRVMGLADVTLFMVTAGCSLQWTATAAAAGPSSLIVWLFGVIGMFLPISVSVVFLSACYPEEGGLCSWTRRAFGQFVGFMTGWTYWSGTLAFLPSVLYFSAGSALLSTPGNTANASPVYFVCFSIAAILGATILNVRGLAKAKWLNGAGAVARWVGILLLIVLALATWWRFGSATDINRHTIVPSFRLADVIFWTALAFAFTGPEAASFMDAEIREPRRTIPRALALAAPMIAAVYIVGTACILFAIPPERAAGVYGAIEAIRAAAGRLDLSWLIPLGGACVVVDRIGSMCLWMGALARLPTSVGVDRYLPKRFTRLHPKYGTPAFAIWTQAIVVALLVILGQSGTSVRGGYNVLIEMMIVSSLVPFLFLFGAAIKLSAGEGVVRKARIPGGRLTVVVIALIGIATTIASMVISFVPPPDEEHPTLAVIKIGGLTAVLLLGGAALYAAGSLRARRQVALAL
jgi:glutamate:GABA antiporter